MCAWLHIAAAAALAFNLGLGGALGLELLGQGLASAASPAIGTVAAKGSFRLDNLPAGTTTVTVFFTGLDPQEAAVTVAPGRDVCSV